MDKLTAVDISQLNLGLGFLIGKSVKEISIASAVALAHCFKEISGPLKVIEDLNLKLNREYWKLNGKGEPELIKGKENEYREQVSELDKTVFEVSLKKNSHSNIENLEGITAMHILQLLPILE